jgi:hypothetical protein
VKQPVEDFLTRGLVEGDLQNRLPGRIRQL